MLKTYQYEQLSAQDIDRLTLRNTDPNNAIQDTVEQIIAQVEQNGDDALRQLALKYDQISLNALYLDEAEIEALAATISRQQQRALEIAFQNIHKF